MRSQERRELSKVMQKPGLARDATDIGHLEGYGREELDVVDFKTSRGWKRQQDERWSLGPPMSLFGKG